MKLVVPPKYRVLALFVFLAVIAGIVLVRSPRAHLYLTYYDPSRVAQAAAMSDLVVTGTFHVGWPLPWLDGWHYRSELRVKDVLVGSKGIESIPFRWQRPFGVDEGLDEDMQHLDRRPGVWFVVNDSGNWKLVSQRMNLWGDPLTFPDSQEIRSAVLQAKSRHKGGV
jgi:hypothetical protein